MNKITIYQADDNDTHYKFENFIEALLDFFFIDKESVKYDDKDLGSVFDFKIAIELIGNYVEYHASTDYLDETSRNFYDLKNKFENMPLHDIYIIDIAWQDKGSLIVAGGFELIEILLQRNVLTNNILILSEYGDTSNSAYSTSRLPKERKEYYPLFLSVKGLKDSLEYHLPNALKSSASRYFKELTLKQIKELKENLKEKTNEGILEIDTKIGENDEYHFLLKDLLIGWRNNETGEIENAKEVVKNLLAENQPKYDFVGNWSEKAKTPWDRYWKEYLEIRENKNKKIGLTYEQEVNLHAFNYVLEFISQFDTNFTFNITQEKSPIRKEYHIYANKAMPKTKNSLVYSISWKTFKYKLVARRLLISQECLEEIVNSVQKKYDDVELFDSLLYYSVNNKYKKIDNIRIIYGTHLGFTLDEKRNADIPKKILIETLDGEKTVLPDEEIWIRDFIPMIQIFYNFIEVMNTHDYNLKSFDDIVSLQKSENPTQLLEVWNECIGNTEFTANTSILNIFE
jgi:hypothetical protein